MGRVLCNYLWPWLRTSFFYVCTLHVSEFCVQSGILSRQQNQASDLELVFLCSEIYFKKYYLTASRVLQVQVSLLERTKNIF